MTRARTPRPHEVAAARRDPRLVRAFTERRRDDTWRARGVCRRHDPETFFPAPNEPPDAALSLCRGCDVQGACLAWALDVGDCHGVWGATTPRERRAMGVVWRGEPAGGGSMGADPVGGVLRDADDDPPGSDPAGRKLAGSEPAGRKPAGSEPAGRKPAGRKPAGSEPAGREPEPQLLRIPSRRLPMTDDYIVRVAS